MIKQKSGTEVFTFYDVNKVLGRTGVCFQSGASFLNIDSISNVSAMQFMMPDNWRILCS
jgi:hypothetical protein